MGIPNEKENTDLILSEAKKRIKKKSTEIRERTIDHPIDEDEPLGLLSGGPKHLNIPDD